MRAGQSKDSPRSRLGGSKRARKYNHTVEPFAISERNGKLIVRGKVSGNFPGSPVKLDHIFEIEGDRIVSLEIRP